MSQLKSIAKNSLLVLLAMATGLGTAWWSVKHVPASAQTRIQAGVWQGSTLTGSSSADDLTRARVAVSGLLALDRSETIYFVARTDSQLRPLRARCTYQISGTAPAARWWSITAYADDHFLFDAVNRQFSFSGDGTFKFSTGPTGSAGMTWLPTPGDRGLELVLRLYQPSPALQAAPASLSPPVIEQIGACA
jgi:hypothetical protein